MADRNDTPFYVGYLDIPKALKGPARLIALVLLLIAGLAAAWIASGARDAGQGYWGYGIEQTLTGRIALAPYPMLHVAGEAPQTVLLVVEGKLGAEAFVAPFDGQMAEVTGYDIHRGPWRMLELRTADDVKPVAGAGLTVAEGLPQPLGRVTLKGEIIDSKCFLGVMKPGEGPVHRACATLCILGGIPPMFALKDAEGNRAAYLLTDTAGNRVNDAVPPYVADPVEISGTLERRGDILVLKADMDSLRRLVGDELVAYGPRLIEGIETAICTLPG